jgi:multidrug efflux pump subunit AcrA (membrane-fusion protein)
MTNMNYETGAIGGGSHMALEGPAPARRRWIPVVVVLVLVALLGWYLLAGKKHDSPAGASASTQIPNITVVVPGQQTVSRVVSATGTLAARREMPVGVAGEGGMITRVLVEPGQWVRAGQVLATVDRSVQTQTASALNAQVAVAQSDQQIAQAELDRAQQLVDRGFISQADLQRRRAQVVARIALVLRHQTDALKAHQIAVSLGGTHAGGSGDILEHQRSAGLCQRLNEGETHFDRLNPCAFLFHCNRIVFCLVKSI